MNSLLILITIPLGLYAAVEHWGTNDTIIFQLSGLETAQSILLTIVLPTGLGIVIGHYYPNIVEQTRRPLKVVTVLLISIIFSIKLLGTEAQGGSGIQMTEILYLLPYVLILHLLTMMLSYNISNGFSIKGLTSITIGVEVGLQNTSLALMICASFMSYAELSKPTIVYSTFSFFTTLIFAFLAKKYLDKKEQLLLATL
jgi:BASS family bile acid:Na+ symporter